MNDSQKGKTFLKYFLRSDAFFNYLYKTFFTIFSI